MDEVANTLKPLSQQGKGLGAAATDKLQSGIQATEQAAANAADKASDDVNELGKNAASLVDKVTDQAQKLMEHGQRVFKERSERVRDMASQASELMVDYTRDEPLKAMLMAVAAGALLMGVFAALLRSRD